MSAKGVKQRLSKEVISNYPLETAGGIQNVLFVNEDGLYDVIFESRKPEAKAFRKWVTGEVLPSIRKTGRFEVEQATSAVDSKLLHQKLVVATFAMEALHMSDVSRLTVVEPIARQFGVTLPEYVQSKGVLKSATELLRRSKSDLDIRRFNDRMVELGYLVVNRRKTSKGVDKTFKTLTEKGMEFGENLVSKYCPMETQPEYYSDKFETLLSKLKK